MSRVFVDLYLQVLFSDPCLFTFRRSVLWYVDEEGNDEKEEQEENTGDDLR